MKKISKRFILFALVSSISWSAMAAGKFRVICGVPYTGVGLGVPGNLDYNLNELMKHSCVIAVSAPTIAREKNTIYACVTATLGAPSECNDPK